MDVLPDSASGHFELGLALDARAPVGARVLLMLFHLDAQIEGLQNEQMSLVRRLEQVKREARAAHEELRAQEIQLMFVESSSGCTAPGEAVQRMREWLDGASARCAELAARAQSEMEVAASTFDSIHRRAGLLCERRRAVPVPPELLRLYEASPWAGSSPRVVAVERDACSACGARAPASRPESSLQACMGCHRIIYWPIQIAGSSVA